MELTEFENMVILGAKGPEPSEDPTLSRSVIACIRRALPENGNLDDLGPTPRKIKLAMRKRIKEQESGVGFGPIFIILLGAFLDFLIQWWFHDGKKDAQTLQQVRNL